FQRPRRRRRLYTRRNRVQQGVLLRPECRRSPRAYGHDLYGSRRKEKGPRGDRIAAETIPERSAALFYERRDAPAGRRIRRVASKFRKTFTARSRGTRRFCL